MKKLLLASYFISLVLISGLVQAQDSIRIMPIGDSITELNWQGGYRSYLYKLLSDSGFTFDFVGRQTKNHDQNSLGFAFPQPYWDHEGYTGRAIFPTWLDHIDTALMANHPDIILLMLGTNDVANGTRSALQIRNYMSALLDSIWKFDPKIKIVLSNLPRVVPGSLFSQKKLDTTINTNALWPGLVNEKKLAGRYITMVDNYNVLTDSTDFDGDGVHPSVAGYKKMRYVWYPAVVSAMLTTSVRMKAQSNPQTFELDQNYPNPFNPSTNIRYSIPSESYVTLNVYDLLGRLVTSLVEGKQSVGTHSVTFNVAALPTGVYIYAMRAGNFTAARKMVLIK